MVICFKCQIKEVEGLHFLCSENKGVDQLLSYCAADLRLCFAYAKSRFSQDPGNITFYNIPYVHLKFSISIILQKKTPLHKIQDGVQNGIRKTSFVVSSELLCARDNRANP